MANDSRYDLPITEKAKKVVVVGGGPAGIEAAKLLKRRGHDVTIIEKSDKLGGQIYHAMAPNNKTHFKPLIPYYYATVEANNIPVLYNTEATVESVLAMEPDVVICATGVKPRKLPIPGLDLPNVLTEKEYLVGEREVTGNKVVVVGGGDVGCEVAEKLASEGKDVTIIEMQSILAPGYTFGNRCCLMHQLHRYNVKQWLGTKIYSAHEDHIVAEDLVGFRFDIACDNVVMCTGDRADDALYKELWGKVPEVYNLGDSSGPASLAKAHADAFTLAKKI